MESFAEIAETWLADVARTRRPKTLDAYRIAVGKLLEVVPEGRERFITRADLTRFRDARADDCSVLSANRDLKALKACLNWAWTCELPQPPVPLKRLLLPPPPRKDETLTQDEIGRLLDAAQFDVPVLVILRVCHGTGLRLDEVLNLTWSDVSAEDGSISVTAKPWWQPKTNAALRTVYAPELVRWLVRYPETLRHDGPDDRVCQMDPHKGNPGRSAFMSACAPSTTGPGSRGRSPPTASGTRSRATSCSLGHPSTSPRSISGMPRPASPWGSTLTPSGPAWSRRAGPWRSTARAKLKSVTVCRF